MGLPSPIDLSSPNAELVIRDVTPAISTFSAPFGRGPIPFGGRSTAVKLQDGNLFLVASTPLDQPTVDKLAQLGPVKHILAPDAEHTLYTAQYAKNYPDASLYVPLRTAESWAKDADRKQYADRITFTFGKGQPDPFPALTGGEIESADWGKAHGNEEIAILHKPSKTLIEADLLFNLPPTEQYSKSKQKSTAFYVTGALKPGTWSHKKMVSSLLNKDNAVFKEQSKKVAGWDFDRVIPCHGDVIETGGKKAWLDTYASLLN